MISHPSPASSERAVSLSSHVRAPPAGSFLSSVSKSQTSVKLQPSVSHKNPHAQNVSPGAVLFQEISDFCDSKWPSKSCSTKQQPGKFGKGSWRTFAIAVTWQGENCINNNDRIYVDDELDEQFLNYIVVGASDGRQTGARFIPAVIAKRWVQQIPGSGWPKISLQPVRSLLIFISPIAGLSFTDCCS